MLPGFWKRIYDIMTLYEQLRVIAVKLRLQASDSGVPPTSPDYYIVVDSKGNWDLADSNTADKPLEHTVANAKFTKLKEAVRRANFSVPSFMMDVVNFAVGHTSAQATL